MECIDGEKSPLDIEDLIRQGEAWRKKWKLTRRRPGENQETWQEVLDNRKAPAGM